MSRGCHSELLWLWQGDNMSHWQQEPQLQPEKEEVDQLGHPHPPEAPPFPTDCLSLDGTSGDSSSGGCLGYLKCQAGRGLHLRAPEAFRKLGAELFRKGSSLLLCFLCHTASVSFLIHSHPTSTLCRKTNMLLTGILLFMWCLPGWAITGSEAGEVPTQCLACWNSALGAL